MEDKRGRNIKMRCSGTSCGKEGDGNFCDQCGAKMVEEKVDTVIVCSGKLDNDSSCGAELVAGQKFCKKCGTKVDQTLFASLQDACSKCGTVLESEATFCTQCGHRLEKLTADGKSLSIKKEKESAASVDHKDSNTESTEAMQRCTDNFDESKENVGVDTNGSENSNEVNMVTSENSEADSLDTTEGNADIKELSMVTNTDAEVEGGDETKKQEIRKQTAVIENTNKNMSQQLQDIGKEKQDNLNDTQSTEEIVGEEVLKSEGHTGEKDDVSMMQNVGNGQVKRSIGKNENDKKRRPENETGTGHPDNKIENSGAETLQAPDKCFQSKSADNQNDTEKGEEVNNLCGGHMKPDATQNPVKQEQVNSNEAVLKENSNDNPVSSESPDDRADVNGYQCIKDDEKKRNETDSNKIPTSQRVFGTDRAIGMSQTENDIEIKTPFGEKLFSVGNQQKNEQDNPQKNGQDSQQKNGQYNEGTNGENKQGEIRKDSQQKNGKNNHQNNGQDNQQNNGKDKQQKNRENNQQNKEQYNQQNSGQNNHQKTEQAGSKNAHPGGQGEHTVSYPLPDNGILAEKSEVYTNNFNAADTTQEYNEGADVDNSNVRVTRSMAQTKTTEQNKNKQQDVPKKQTKTTENKQKAAETHKNEKCIKVQFHALTSEEFKFDPLKDTCILVIGNEEMGGWMYMDRIMKEKRKVERFIHEMIYEERIPTRLIAGGQSIPYKYLILKKDKPENEYWEHYIKDKKTGLDANRDLTVTLRLKSLDIWHQFDFFIEYEPKSLKDKISDYFNWRKDMQKHAEKAIQIFCPEIMESDKSYLPVDDVIQLFKMASDCMKKIYMLDGKCWHDMKEFAKFMGASLMNTMKEKWIVDTTKNGSAEQREQSTAAALTILYVSKTLELGMPDTNSIHTLTKALIMRVDSAKKDCPELILADKLFHGKRKELLEAVLTLVRGIANTSKDPCWLFLMPWVHFLSGACVPFEKPEVDLKHDSPDDKWWGITKIATNVTVFKNYYSNWLIPMKNMLKHLQPLFEIDYLMPRTFIAAVDLIDLPSLVQSGSVPEEVCLANFIFQARVHMAAAWYSHESRAWRIASMSTEEKVVQECINLLLNKLQATFFSEECCLHQWTMCYIFASQLFKESFRTKRIDTIYLCLQIILHCIAMYDRVLTEQRTEHANKKKDHHVVLRDLAKETVEWLERYYFKWSIYMQIILKVWDKMFAPVQLQSEEIGNVWNDHMAEALVTNLQNKVCTENYQMKQFVQLYCQKVDEFNPYMQECMSKAAFLAIEKGYTLDYGSFTEDENRRFGILLSELFLNEWKKRMSNSQIISDERMLRHALRWPAFPQYLKIYYKDGRRIGMLTDECIQYLVQTVSVIDSRLIALLTGALTIEDFNLITEKDSKFSEVAELVQTKKDCTAEFIQKAIEIRQKEFEGFRLQAKEMATLASLCTQLNNVDTKGIDDTLKKQRNIEKHKIHEFCEPADVAKILNVKNFQPRLNAFNVPQIVGTMVPQLRDCYESSTFMLLWNKQCQEVKNQCFTLEDVVQKVWDAVKKRWDTISERIKKGVVKFREFEDLLGQRYRNSYDQMQTEMRTMKIPEKIIGQRVDQLRKYRQLSTCVKGAKTILKFKQEYNLTGDFTQIRSIATHGDNDQEMKAFDVSVMKACEFLKDLIPEKEKCLEVFVTCERLVKWLRESMQKSGLKELKVFVDLALMSAGDEPINIARVQCLHSAVTGYAPLIFDLKESCDYKELLNLCSLVWKELEANPELPEKLRVTYRHLQWLKEIKKAHGSVEVTSLMQAESINEKGIFTVGKNAWKDAQFQQDGGTLMVLADTVKLTVPEQEGKRGLRNYTFSQLQDLQSRLMLVAGKAEKGTDSVERFTMIFDSITRLSNVYMKLCASGCVLFKDWTARFFCDPNPGRPVCAVLEFGQGEGVSKLKGRRSDSEDLKDMIPELARFMETCLDEWLKYIKKKRRSFLHLNYFTVDQLVILQRELVKFGTVTEPSHLIYSLLSVVKENCCPDDVLDAMTAAKGEIEGETEINAEDDDVTDGEKDQAQMTLDFTEDEKKQNFVEELVRSGYDETLAIRALDFVDPEDITAGIVWCMDNEDTALHENPDQSLVGVNDPVIEQDQQRPAFSGWSQSQTDIQAMIAANISELRKKDTAGSAPLINGLTALWTQFIESISSSIRDYLSLEHLGLILKYLALKDTTAINRSLPPGLKEGQPNLIICPSGDVLLTTLSVYMMDKDQPLPQSDEVLMCTNKTTKDEVDIFWRRAIFDGGRKIHCLMHADTLDYDVSEAAERCLEDYLLEVHYERDLKYRMLVICGSDNEYKSTVVSSLDKYKRQPLPTSTTHLRQYLASKLTMQQQTISTVRPAACVDRQRSSVRVVKSWRAGVGKTLFKQRRENELAGLNSGNIISDSVSIPLQEKGVDLHYIIQRLLEHTTLPGELGARLFHVDVSHEVENGVDYLLFNLLVLGCLMDKTGFVWRKSPTDIYLIETMPLMMQATNRRGEELQYVHPILSILPDLTCRSPQESLQIYMGKYPKGYTDFDQLFDEEQFESQVFQRTSQYLQRLDQGRTLEDVSPEDSEGDYKSCLQTLLKHCGTEDPSWSELHHFVWFLNTQLVDFENSSYVSSAASEDLPGFAKFVLRFLIQMSRDFSTRSLDMSEESPGVSSRGGERFEIMELDELEDGETDENADDLQRYQMRRTWESSPHPYLFFNSDRSTFTFLGFFIDRASGNVIDQQTGDIVEHGLMKKTLYDALVANRAPIQENFDDLPRHKKIMKMCSIMGNEFPHDPDDTYELTADNVKKIMAIYMRFRCDIPVIIMGETGCGKTRLVKFMCALQVPPGVEQTNMILMKVHGGTTNKDIIKKVREAEEVAMRNKAEYGNQMYTVLFFDEANSTEAIGLIKEIMCDRSMEGKKLELCENLKMVAACNPYRKHTEELIKKLEQAGLGYHVDADDTIDRLGRVPMRRLVYRVQPLPQSLLPLVWDFGQLNIEVEDLYIRQMVRRYIREDDLPNLPGLIEVVSAVLTASQDYMRQQKDECSFVSLRDIDRVLTVMSWFYKQSSGDNTLFQLIKKKIYGEVDETSEDDEESEKEEELIESDIEEELIIDKENDRLDDVTRSLILALGVCYHACLKTRPDYREHVAQFFRAPCHLPGGDDQIRQEIECCQEVFLDYVHLEKNIAKNMALKENVFMMVVCIELRIPLFLVGKPGSSKSLAKTIVSDAMQGNAANETLFKKMKQAQMVSFQCSPLSTPDGIVGTFRQCAQLQKDKDLDSFVSIVVLDEVGLAEDSPRMPLKTLHPLLEDGCQGDEEPEKYKKVAFIGISNWALDPAKMNRGILVQREVPDLEELKNSATGICNTDDNLDNWIKPLIEPMATSYLEIFETASQNMREFYGLRDFYSLVKMVYSFVEKSQQKPTWHQMLHAIKRNFGGLDQVDPVESFRKHLATVVHFEQEPKPSDPDCSPAGLVQACLFDTNKMKSESRYLLLLTENYGTLAIIQQQILSRRSATRPITIFGSSFRSDQEYTQVCRNINKIKVCMETGNTVVLLNLENLYESLYDALNQYYVYFGGERYVDLGLGTHRVKCPVHKSFRLIVVAEKKTVYKKFPIPLINRLEKHFLTINTMLSAEQQEVVKTLEDWADRYVTQRHATHRREKTTTKIGDVFIGFHDDTCSAIVLDVWEKNRGMSDEKDNAQVLQDAKSVLLWCATPESLVRLDNGTFPNEERRSLKNLYFKRQAHESLIQYVNMKIVQQECEQLFAQITTHSKLLASIHKKEISKATGVLVDKILLLETLSSFDTEQQFSNRIQQHIQSTDKDPSLMVIQCDSGDINANLIACARYCVIDEFEKMRGELRAPVHVVFIVQLPRGASFSGFQCGLWHSAHIDDLYTVDMDMPTLQDMQDKSVAKLFTDAVRTPVSMETDEEILREKSEEMGGMENMYSSENCGMAHDVTGMKTVERDMTGEPLQLDDVLSDLQSVDSHVSHGSAQRMYGQNELNVKGLIQACVQSALSMVKDKVENTSKETDRVAIVLKLLHQEQIEGQASFLHGVCFLIAKLLKEKESETTVNARHWLINEAATSENINKAGTFRRSCIQILESKVSPILAGIIAYLDTNDNLKIIQDEQCGWKQELWFTYLNTVEAIDLKFTDLQSPTRQSDLQEVVVITTGCEGHIFSARMPFSWLLINKINEILELHNPSAESQGHLEEDELSAKAESSIKVLGEHALGKVLSCVTEEEVVKEAVLEYIHDFVHIVYHTASEQELQLICQSVYSVTNNMVGATTEKPLLHRLVVVHIAYQKLAPRLTYFRAMNSVWPECSTTIIELKEKKPDHFMFKEQEFTFSALCLLLETLHPKHNELNNQKGRSHWLNKVHRYRPIVEKVISLPKEDPNRYGAHSFQSVRRAEGLWNRVMVVKLFLEHVCASAGEDKITIRHCMPLWTILSEETDLKEMKSLVAVEKFLKSCYKQAMKEYMGEEVKCSNCESALEGPPVILPCKDVLCDQCYDDMKALGENTCTKCQEKFPDDLLPGREIANKNAIEKLKAYQKRCNTFFMDVVSQLCFTGNTAPAEQVVEKLLGYIFCTTRGKQRTRDLTVFDTGIDPNPVFRSFLLQHLMRTSENRVTENLENYLIQAKVFVRQDSPEQEQQYVELCLLVIQCLEDMLTQEAAISADETYFPSQALRRATKTIIVEDMTVEKLYGLASARMGLAIAAKFITNIVMSDVKPGDVDRKVRKLIEAAQTLCEDSNIRWTRVYLVKQLCRCYGMDVYQRVCKSEVSFLQWINTRETRRDQVVEVCDRYIVCGQDYKRVRESVTKVALGESVQHLTDIIQELYTAGVRIEPILQLAVHREITSAYLYQKEQRKMTQKVIQTLATFVGTCEAVKNKDLLQALIMNQLVPRHLVIVEIEDLRLQGIQCLIVHTLAVMSHLNGNGTLLQPLISLIDSPQACTNSLLPTMPQDDLDDVKEALLAARNQGEDADQNPLFYRCPNGHPYVIGDCGRPATVGNCRDCGAAIGGEDYILHPGNVPDQGTDNTMTGHILGKAEGRGHGARPERTLTPAYCSSLRLLMHIAMYIGAGTHPQAIQKLIKPDIEVHEVEDFLWDHIRVDIDDLHAALGRSVDDVLLLMHSVIDTILRTHNEGEQVDAEMSQLSTKRGRQQWETTFCTNFLQESLQNMDNILKKGNQELIEDQRLGADPLLCLLYEADTNVEHENPALLQENPSVWRYRTPISLQHLRQQAEAKISQNQHRVLQLFLNEDHHLRALRYIPSILRLHRALFQKYQRKLDKAEASQISVAQLKRDEVAGGETAKLIQDFAEAWDLIRESLPLYLCPTGLGGTTVSKEYCTKRIDDKTKVAVLLPTIKEAGLCSYTLLDFLMRKQNAFLDKYMKETHRKPDSISSVSPRDVTTAHLICYDAQHDILPLVLANCQYSFEMGKGTKIEYDFAGLERQLMDRFLFSKSRIDVGRVLQIDQMVYRTEFTNAAVFRKLADKIPQETLSAAVKTQICDEIRSLPDLCMSLDNLDITISFLKSTGGPPEKTLHEFMVETLQMEHSIHSQKAKQTCEFKHAQSLWLVLSLQKAMKMIDHHQPKESTFESVTDEFHEELPDELLASYRDYMKKLSIDKLSQLVEVLHEYILLVVAVRQNIDDEDYTDTTANKLGEWLHSYVESMEIPPLDIAILADFPKEILYKHSVHTWISAYGMLGEKKTGHYSRF